MQGFQCFLFLGHGSMWGFVCNVGFSLFINLVAWKEWHFMKIRNASQFPKRYFGLHMCEGVAQYTDPNENGGKPYCILVKEQAAKNMDASFEGKPLYVQHVDEVVLSTLERDADGYVIRSFFNEVDGKHWAEFLAVSDEAHAHIKKGWKLSNAYLVKTPVGRGGEWHAVPYTKEVMNAEYDHLAIVNNPRYAESIILTPDEFKEYNAKKRTELTMLQNSKETKQVQNKKQTEVKSMGFNFFKKTKVENSGEDAINLDDMSVVLPKSKKEVELSKLINAADELQLKSGKPVIANASDVVKIDGDEDTTVGELIEEVAELKANAKKNKKNEDMGDEEEEMDNADEEDDDKEKMKKKDKKDNESEDDKDDEKEKSKNKNKKKNSSDDEQSKENFKKQKNAKEQSTHVEERIFMTNEDKVAKGKELF